MVFKGFRFQDVQNGYNDGTQASCIGSFEKYFLIARLILAGNLQVQISPSPPESCRNDVYLLQKTQLTTLCPESFYDRLL